MPTLQWHSARNTQDSGWYIYYARCQVAWASKLKTMVAPSTTEAKQCRITRISPSSKDMLKAQRSSKFQFVTITLGDTFKKARSRHLSN
ncbi:hypothetical protein ACHAXS_004624 [Conticribra weissflogii]